MPWVATPERLPDDQPRSHHSGFGIDRRVVLAAGDTKGLERVARYMLRCPFSLARLVNVNERGQVIYRAETHRCHRFPQPGAQTLFPGVARNFQVFEPLDFIAELTQHVPEQRPAALAWWLPCRREGR